MVDSVTLMVELHVANSSSDLQLTQISYKLDGSVNASMEGLEKVSVFDHPGGSSWIIMANTTLTHLSYDNHTVTVFAKTSSNDILSFSMSFKIEINPSPTLTASPTPKEIGSGFSKFLLAVCLTACVAVASVILAFIFFKKRNHSGYNLLLC
jgi:hypothetical protein